MRQAGCFQQPRNILVFERFDAHDLLALPAGLQPFLRPRPTMKGVTEVEDHGMLFTVIWLAGIALTLEVLLHGIDFDRAGAHHSLTRYPGRFGA